MPPTLIGSVVQEPSLPTLSTPLLFSTEKRNVEFPLILPEVYFKTMKEFEETFKDPEYADKVRPDEYVCFDRDKTEVILGYEFPIFEDGKVVAQ
ncbi:hypothetical protein BDZ91DRAFT_790010 [Kalaharituber pfeilii]|nr:hypothetical protein BDZ91DRAFT_790010 [Kalaharituber pfeilii]